MRKMCKSLTNYALILICAYIFCGVVCLDTLHFITGADYTLRDCLEIIALWPWYVYLIVFALYGGTW
jgi:hypothetical protein